MLGFPWKGLWEIAIAAWLSTKTFVLSFCSMLRSIKIFSNHKTWLSKAVATTNSASAVDCATISCSFELHEKTPDPKLKQYPEVLFISSIEPPQSQSDKPVSLNSSVHLHLMPKFQVLLTYLITLFAALRCISLGQCINRDKILTAFKMSGWVAVRYILNTQLCFWNMLGLFYRFHLPAQLFLLIHWSVHFFAFFIWTSSKSPWHIFLTNEDFMFSLFDLNAKKEGH